MVKLAIKDPIREKQMFFNRAAILFVGVIALIGMLVLRMVQLQVWEFEAYQTRSDQNRIQVQPLAPPRGLIFDRHGEVIADNRVSSSLALVTERIEDLASIIQKVSVIVGITPAEISEFEKRFSRKRRPYQPIVLRDALNEEEIALLAVNRHEFVGVEVIAEQVREYPFGDLLAHAIGSVRRVNEEDLQTLDEVRYSGTRFVGKLGVERYYERSLHGEVGYQQVETDAHGRIRQVLDIQPPIAGHNITLHLDNRLQIAASAALGQSRGAVVALDPRSGGILAMVSQPGYDPNLFITGMSGNEFGEISGSKYKPLFNRAINGQYAPGSTFKPVVGLAGLVSEVTSWDEVIQDTGAFRLPGLKRLYRDWSWRTNNSGGQGEVDLFRAIYRSSNVFFYDIASRMEPKQLIDFADQFGFGRDLAVDVAGASGGLLPDPVWKKAYKGEIWYPGDNVNMGIGQGDLLVTPLQMATVAATLANRGRVVRPRMLLASDSVLIEADATSAIPSVSGPTPEDWEKMASAMEAVVHRGNQGFRGNGTVWAYIGRDISYRMAGKSGTAQVVEIKQGQEYKEEELEEFNRKHAWFIAFAPIEKPVIALAVLVENGGGGSSVAAPVAREVIDAYLLPQLAAR
ncbi:MAG: penicillin-binding protein 2 [Pseudomonadales bacterium]|nr:penicillin-binding protein 2 [Pseudomonadales bacterium]